MTRIERVISMHHRLAGSLKGTMVAEYRETVLEALREKQERENGCEWCAVMKKLQEQGRSNDDVAFCTTCRRYYPDQYMCGRDLKARGE